MGVSFADKLIQAQLVFNRAFLDGVESLKDGIDLVPISAQAAEVNQPGTEETVFGFLNELPLFRKWAGDRRPSIASVSSYSVKVEDYEWSYQVGRNEIKYDKFGLLAETVFRAAVAATRRFGPDLITQAKKDGKTRTCFDGQNYYDTSHPQALNGTGTTFQNLWTSMTLIADNIWTRYQYMTQLKDANGKRLGIRPNIIEYGPGQIQKVRTALNQEITAQAIKNIAGTENVAAAGVSNTLMGLLTPQMNPDLEDGVWYLHDTRIMKPFIMMWETQPTGLLIRDRPDDPAVWNNKLFYYSSDATAATGYTLPHLSSRQEE